MEKPQLLPTPEFYKRLALFGENFFAKFKKHPVLYTLLYFFLFVCWFLFEDYLAEKGRDFVSEHMGKALPFMSTIYHWLATSGLGIFGFITLLFTLVLIGHAYWETMPKKRTKQRMDEIHSESSSQHEIAEPQIQFGGSALLHVSTQEIIHPKSSGVLWRRNGKDAPLPFCLKHQEPLFYQPLVGQPKTENFAQWDLTLGYVFCPEDSSEKFIFPGDFPFPTVQIFQQQAEARIRGKQALPAFSPPLPLGIFEIEILEGELHWRDAGKQQLVPFTPDPDGQTPDTATVVLALYATITAIPAQLLENIELAIVGQLLPLPSGYWHSTEISGERSNYFYFELPPSIPLGKHPVRLIATTSLRGASFRRESPPFDTYTARTYRQLHAYDPQKFPDPS